MKIKYIVTIIIILLLCSFIFSSIGAVVYFNNESENGVPIDLEVIVEAPKSTTLAIKDLKTTYKIVSSKQNITGYISDSNLINDINIKLKQYNLSNIVASIANIPSVTIESEFRLTLPDSKVINLTASSSLMQYILMLALPPASQVHITKLSGQSPISDYNISPTPSQSIIDYVKGEF